MRRFRRDSAEQFRQTLKNPDLWRNFGEILAELFGRATLSNGKKLRFTIPWPRRGFSYMKRYAKDLTADEILTYEPNTPVDIYGMAIGVKPGVSLSQKRLYGERLILGAKSVLLDLAKRGIIIRRIIAHSFTPDGIRLMKHIGFTETPSESTRIT